MDSSERAQDTHHHYWLIVLVIVAGLAITWFVADKAVSGYEKRAHSQHQQQHELLRLRLQERLNNLFDGIGWVVVTAGDNPALMRQSIAAFTNSYPAIVSAGLVQHTAESDSLLWEYNSALHRQGSRLPLLLQEVRPFTGLMENPPISRPVIVTPRINLSANQEQQEAMGVLRHAGDNRWLTLVVNPQRLINSMAGPRVDTLRSIAVHDLDQHSKSPLFEATAGNLSEDTLEQRSELSVGNRTWLLSTHALPGDLAPGARRSWQSVWLTGLTITVLFALTCYLLARRISMLQSRNHANNEELDQLRQQLGNIRVEKSIMRQALEDSEQRSRDLVDLSPDITAELDDYGRIGFVSGQVADLLGHAPTDLSDRPISELIPGEHQQAFDASLEAARQEHSIHATDLTLLNRQQDTVAVTIRILALRDAVYGCTGYRLSIRAVNPGV